VIEAAHPVLCVAAMNKLGLGLLVVAAVVVPRRADACSVDATVPLPTCRAADVLLPLGAQVPPGLPGIPFIPLDSSDFALYDAAGQLVPSARLDNAYEPGKLLKPNAPLLANSEYRITYKDSCVTAPTNGAERKSFTFRTSADAPLPTTLGTVTQQKKLETKAVVDSCGVERERKPAASATLTLTPSAELLPWLPLLSIAAGNHGAPLGAVRLQDGKIVLEGLAAYCDGSGQLKPALQDVVVSARVAGASTQPAPVALKLDLLCAGASQTGGVDGGISQPGEAASASDDGCALGGGSQGAWTLALCLAALLRRRRACRSEPASS
jgi:hypothetical protein